MNEMLGLAGRSVTVVGAGGGGIGSGICIALARAGAHVAAIDIDEARLAGVHEAIREAGGECTQYPIDASDAAPVEDVVFRACQERDSAGLVNVVGGLPLDRWEPLIETSPERFGELLDRNLRCALLSSTAFARCQLERTRGGSIVQIASIAAQHGMPFGAGYAAAKAALISLMRTMALEWGPRGVRANAVAPGTIEVPRKGAVADEARDRAHLPLGRRGRPSDVAGAVLFLLSDLATWVTGQTLVVDGGASARPSYIDETGLPVFVSDGALRERLLR